MNNEALDQVDVERVLGDEGLDYRITWGRSGRLLNARQCPFCGNNKWKTYINAETGMGTCFAGSCTQGNFNKWQLMKAIFNLNTRDTRAKIEALAASQGWRPVRKVVRYNPPPLAMPKNYKVDDLYALPKYLLDRGITTDLARYFDLRWCEDGMFAVQNPDGKVTTQSYANRVLIPIYDASGKMVSFQGRDATGTADRKYLFPPMYASTGSHLYNIQNWGEGMDTVVIGEGVFDVIGIKRALDAAHINNMLPVGSFGMSLTVNQSGDDQMGKLLYLKELGLRQVIFLWDNEPKAIHNAIHAAHKVAMFGFKAYVAKLDTNKDPGEADVKAIHEAILNAHPVRNTLDCLLLEKKLCP